MRSIWILMVIILLTVLPAGAVERDPADADTAPSGWSVRNFSPEPVTAGQKATWRLQVTAGRRGLLAGGKIRFLHRHTSDFGPVQFDYAARPGYIRLSDTAGLKWKVRRLNHVEHKVWLTWDRGWELELAEGRFDPGRSVELVIGDRSGGGPGVSVQTYVERAFRLRVQVARTGRDEFQDILPVPRWEIRPGPPARIRLHVPSQVRAGERFSAVVLAEDENGNHAAGYAPNITLLHSHDGRQVPMKMGDPFRESDGTWLIRDIVFEDPGFHYLAVLDTDAGFTASSNPVRSVAADEQFDNLYWGDLHVHTYLSDGTGTLDDNYLYGRDVARLDFMTVTDHAYLLTDREWRESLRVCRAYHRPGRFLTFPAYEWSEETAAGGDHNVYFLEEGPLFRSAKGMMLDPGQVRTPTNTLYRFLKREHVMIIPHVGGRRANLDWHDPDLEPLLEIVSMHGIFEDFGLESLRRGYRMGFVGGGDGHHGRPGYGGPGKTWAQRNNAITAVRAPSLTREDIWKAMTRRLTYATTGTRIWLEVHIDGQPMGAEVQVKRAPEISVVVAGTAPIKTIDIIRNAEVLFSIAGSNRVQRIQWLDQTFESPSWYVVRVVQNDGETAWSSPIRVRRGWL